MIKILFVNTNCSWNKGSAAQVISTRDILKNFFPDAEFTLISHYSNLDSKYCEIEGLKVVESLWSNFPLVNKLGSIYFLTVFPLINIILVIFFKLGLEPYFFRSSALESYENSDIILDLSGDSFNDIKGVFSFYIDTTLLLGLALKKPVVLYSQSIGPIKKLSIPFTRYSLNKVDGIIIRDEITKNYLRNIGVKKDMDLISDCAFVLEPSSEERIDQILAIEKITLTEHSIGISANAILYELYEDYVVTMSKIVDYIIETFNTNVVFVPHVVSPTEGGKEDDRLVAEKIYVLANNKDNIQLVKGDYSPRELKGIIKNFKIFIGGRMHANIAALSSGVPIIATAWNHKYKGIMMQLGLDEFVFSFKDMSLNDFKKMIDKLWNNQDQIRLKLENKLPEQKNLALNSGKLIKNLID